MPPRGFLRPPPPFAVSNYEIETARYMEMLPTLSGTEHVHSTSVEYYDNNYRQ